MSVGRSLGAAAVDFYHQSWRLAALNTALSAAVLVIVYLFVWVLPALVVLLVLVGPLVASLMHCAVKLAQEDELRFRDAVAGLQLHWRRGLVLGAVSAAVTALGVYAIAFYGNRGSPLLAVLAVYLLLALVVFQLVLWPLAVFDRRPLRLVLEEALRTLLARPLQALVLTLALAVVNLVGVALAVVPFLTLTIAYSFLAAAHFTVPPEELG